MRLSRRRTTAAAVASLVAVAAVPAWAQSREEEAVVLHAVGRLMNAIIAKDEARMEMLLAPELSYGHSSGKIENRQEFIETITSGTLSPRSIDLSEERVVVVGDLAIVRNDSTAEAVSREGQILPVRIGHLQVWQKRSGGWVLLAHQAFVRSRVSAPLHELENGH